MSGRVLVGRRSLEEAPRGLPGVESAWSFFLIKPRTGPDEERRRDICSIKRHGPDKGDTSVHRNVVASVEYSKGVALGAAVRPGLWTVADHPRHKDRAPFPAGGGMGETGAIGMGQQECETPQLFTVTLSEEQCRYLGSLFRERVESHEIRRRTGYPQDEEGARLAMELWRAFVCAVPQEDDGSALRGSPDIRNARPGDPSNSNNSLPIAKIGQPLSIDDRRR